MAFCIIPGTTTLNNPKVNYGKMKDKSTLECGFRGETGEMKIKNALETNHLAGINEMRCTFGLEFGHLANNDEIWCTFVLNSPASTTMHRPLSLTELRDLILLNIQ